MIDLLSHVLYGRKPGRVVARSFGGLGREPGWRYDVMLVDRSIIKNVPESRLKLVSGPTTEELAEVHK